MAFLSGDKNMALRKRVPSPVEPLDDSQSDQPDAPGECQRQKGTQLSWARFDRWVIGAISNILRWIFIGFPYAIISSVPHSNLILSFAFFYIFAQTLGLFWMTQTVGLFHLSQEAFHAALEIDIYDPYAYISAGLTAYIYFAVIHLSVLATYGLYTIGWESYCDFPTAYKLLTGRKGSTKSAGLWKSYSSGALEQWSRTIKANLTLVPSSQPTPCPSSTGSRPSEAEGMPRGADGGPLLLQEDGVRFFSFCFFSLLCFVIGRARGLSVCHLHQGPSPRMAPPFGSVRVQKSTRQQAKPVP